MRILHTMLRVGDLARSLAEAAQQRLMDLVQGLSAIVWEADARAARFTIVSQPAEDILGYPVARGLEQSDLWAGLSHHKDRARVAEAYARAVGERAGQDFEFRAIAADRRVVWLRVIVRVVTDERTRAVHARV